MSKTVHVDLGHRGYDIRIGTGMPVVGRLAGESGLKALLVSDSNVDPIYGDKYGNELRESGFSVARAVVPAGERSKDLKQVGFLYDQAVTAGLDRTSLVVALGGGMVGDLAGFVAATFLRGVRFMQIPTTLLAMVDSSVGGKTAINLPQGKNLVGVFHQPIEVVADLGTLASLPSREYVSGLAEVVKYGVIWDAALFREIEGHADLLLSREAAFLEKIIGRCCEIKAEVVAMDELEVGPRAILNFGHTLAHALETISGYGALLHGEAVAIGLAFAGHLSVRLKGFPVEALSRLTSLLQRLGLPTERPAGLEWEGAREAMNLDKKTRGKTLRFVLATKLGSVTAGCDVPEADLREAWNVIGK